MKLYNIIDKDGIVKLSYTNENYAKQILEALNAFNTSKYRLEVHMTMCE